jgi:hypothetical protein
MKRILNVLIISGFAATLACAPASRQQALPKKNVSAQKPPAGTNTPGSQNNGANGQNGTGSGSGSGSGTNSAPVNTTGPVALGSLNVTGIEVGSNDGNLAVKILTKDGDKQPSYVVSVDDNQKVTGDDGVASSQFNCADGTSKPSDCVKGTLFFTIKGQALSADITKVSNLQVDEFIEIPQRSTGDSQNQKIVYKVDSKKQNVGTAEYRQVILSVDSTHKITGLHSTFLIGDATASGTPDDVELSNDANIRIRVYGLPKVDIQNNPIVVQAAASRQQQIKSIFLDSNPADTLRYSVGIVPDKGATSDAAAKILVLVAHPASANADDGTPAPVADAPAVPAQPATPVQVPATPVTPPTARLAPADKVAAPIAKLEPKVPAVEVSKVEIQSPPAPASVVSNPNLFNGDDNLKPFDQKVGESYRIPEAPAVAQPEAQVLQEIVVTGHTPTSWVDSVKDEVTAVWDSTLKLVGINAL